MKFEWDDEKNLINISKHQISFDIAALVFGDENRIEIFDEIHSSLEEDRYIVLGKVHDVLFVVYTERGDVTRLISGRVATSKEKELYYGNGKKNN